jgi:uncharacterized protein YcbK (DUF882 family)
MNPVVIVRQGPLAISRFHPSCKIEVWVAAVKRSPNPVGSNRLLSSYRSSLLGCIVALLSLCPSSLTMADSISSSTAPYRLRFFHTHTGERLDIVYRVGNTYDPNALMTLSHYLRDHRTGDARDYDPRLFDLLHDLTIALGRPNA